MVSYTRSWLIEIKQELVWVISQWFFLFGFNEKIG